MPKELSANAWVLLKELVERIEQARVLSLTIKHLEEDLHCVCIQDALGDSGRFHHPAVDCYVAVDGKLVLLHTHIPVVGKTRLNARITKQPFIS